MKKKIQRVSDLITEYIISNTITMREILYIFKPYIKCKKREYGEIETPITHNTLYGKSYNIIKKRRLLAIFSFDINKRIVKKHNFRKFRTKSDIRHYIWLNYYETEDNKITYKIIISDSDGFTWGNKITLYHLFTMMKKLVPDCLIQIETMLLRKI